MNMKEKIPPIFDLCHCGCGEIVYNGKRFINHHNAKGKNHPFLNKHHSKETKNKMRRPKSEEHKRKLSEVCMGRVSSRKGKKSPTTTGDLNPSKRPDVRKKISKALLGKPKSKEHIVKISGENASNWQGGKSFEPYCSKFNKQKKEEIRNKYNRQCFICDKYEKDNIIKTKNKIRLLSVHHIDLDKEQGCNGKGFKLIPLCTNCHELIHHGNNKRELNNMILNKLGCD